MNKRFVVMSVKRGAKCERLKDDFAWLVDAGVVLPAHIVTESKCPLLRTRVVEEFKLYSSDCGLLLAQYPTIATMKNVEGNGDANYRAVYENAVARELAAAGFYLCYYSNNRKGEVDFLIENDQGDVVPIEVKSGEDYKLYLALNNLMEAKGYGISRAVVLSERNVSSEERFGKPVFYLSLYMTMRLASENRQNTDKCLLDEVAFDGLRVSVGCSVLF